MDLQMLKISGLPTHVYCRHVLRDKERNSLVTTAPTLVHAQLPVIPNDVRARTDRDIVSIYFQASIGAFVPVITIVPPLAIDLNILRATSGRDAVGVIEHREHELGRVGNGCHGRILFDLFVRYLR